MASHNANIKVKVKPGADMGTILNDVLMAAQAASPGSNPHAAEPIRDGNGKIIAINVNLIGDNQGIENARAAINANNGVSTAQSFGGEGIVSDDFEGLSQGVLLASSEEFGVGPESFLWDGGNNPASFINCLMAGDQDGNAGSVLSGGYANESEGNSSFMIQAKQGGGAQLLTGYIFNESQAFGDPTSISGTVAANSVAPYTRIRYSFVLKMPTTVNGVACESHTSRLLNILPAGGGASLKWQEGANVFYGTVDTGVASAASHTIILLVDYSLGGVSTLSVDGTVVIGANAGSGVAKSEFGFVLENWETEMTAGTLAQGDEVPPIIFDNMLWEILA